MRHLLLFLSLVLLVSTAAVAQPDRQADLVQFSGVVVTDSLMPVPFTNILVRNTYRGTMSDVYGYFSFVAQEGDTILFSAVGFERSQYVIPTDRRYRDRALSLMNSAAAELGVGAPRMSSSFTANINVSGGSDPEATAAAVADAVEQAFARKKRREGSLAFS